MSRTQVAEAFASQSKPAARATALYFDGAVAYSYGEHFPLAVITTKPGEHRTATVNTDRYSATTGRHKSMIRHALTQAGYTLTEADTDGIKALVRRMQDAASKAAAETEAG